MRSKQVRIIFSFLLAMGIFLGLYSLAKEYKSKFITDKKLQISNVKEIFSESSSSGFNYNGDYSAFSKCDLNNYNNPLYASELSYGQSFVPVKNIYIIKLANSSFEKLNNYCSALQTPIVLNASNKTVGTIITSEINIETAIPSNIILNGIFSEIGIILIPFVVSSFIFAGFILGIVKVDKVKAQEIDIAKIINNLKNQMYTTKLEAQKSNKNATFIYDTVQINLKTTLSNVDGKGLVLTPVTLDEKVEEEKIQDITINLKPIQVFSDAKATIILNKDRENHEYKNVTIADFITINEKQKYLWIRQDGEDGKPVVHWYPAETITQIDIGDIEPAKIPSTEQLSSEEELAVQEEILKILNEIKTVISKDGQGAGETVNQVIPSEVASATVNTETSEASSNFNNGGGI